MAIVVYKCDTCKREIETSRNQRGLEVINRCIITQGCRGQLYKTDLHLDYVRESLPDDVNGLDNWTKRKALYNHTQRTELMVWTIKHNMGTNPAVVAYVNRPLPENPDYLEELLPTDIKTIDLNTTQLVFDRPWSGIAQLLARSTDIPLQEEQTKEQSPPVLITNSGELTIATRSSIFNNVNMALDLVYSTITGENLTTTYVFDSTPSINSPWVNYNRVVINGKNYDVRSTNIQITEMVEGVIPSGATLYFGNTIRNVDSDVSVPYQQKDKEVIVLLSGEQGTTSDKRLNDFLDTISITASKNNFSLAHDGGELYVDSDIIQSTYPPIQSAR